MMSLFLAALQASTTPAPAAIDCAVTGTDGSREQVLILLTGQRRDPGEGYGAIIRVTRPDWSAVTFGARTDEDPSGMARDFVRPLAANARPPPFWPFTVTYDGGGEVLLWQSERDASGAHYYSFSVATDGGGTTEFNGECSIDREWPARLALPAG